MNNKKHFILRAFIFAAFALGMVLTAGAAPVIARPGTGAPVRVTDNGAFWTLDNGIVKATINKTSGVMTSLDYHGLNTMAGGGDWEETPANAPQLTDTVTIDPASNGGARAEVAIKGVTGGTVMLTPSAPGGGTYCNIEVRYALGRGESGIYAYAIFSHPTNYPAMSVGESRYITRLNHTFDWISVDADRNMLECTPEDWGNGVVIHAKEQRILSTGNYKNSVEHKYSYTAVQFKVPAFGWSSTAQHVGVWFINPTIEYLSGGASKQELVCHFDANDDPDPIILDYWRSTHFGGAQCNIAAGENWSKVIGPIFVYVNSLSRYETPGTNDLETLAATAGNPTVPPAWKDNATALWQDALRQAKVETARWPYDWVNGVDYPHKDERGTVTGQLVLDDPQAKTTRLPNLTVGLAHADYTNTFVRGGGFRFGGTNGFGGRRGRSGGTNGFGGGRFGFGGTNGFGRFGGTNGFGRFGFNRMVDWEHDAKFYEFWNSGSSDGKFTLPNVRPGTYTLHAFADGVLGEYEATNIVVEAGKTLDLGTLDWKPVRYGRQIWEIGYPDRTGGKFFKGDGADYWLWGWPLRYPLLFPDDLTYTIGQSDYRKDWFFEEVPHGTNDFFINPEAKDPANQRFGWIKTGTPGEDMWETVGRGRATTWTIKFNLPTAEKGRATLRVALAGANEFGGLTVAVNGQNVGTIRPISTDAIRYNTDKSQWQECDQAFDATLLKQGENEMQLTVPAGEVTSGVVYDYLRLEVDENQGAPTGVSN
ncbi:MAG TPA: polysaccharide lyase family protein [Verrucomicrobiae bacterium]|jgi:rhamnogalacturonan endolyase